MHVTPTGTVGAIVTGVQLAAATASQIAAIEEAWYAHDVLIVPRQELTDDDLLAFSRHLGQLDAPRVVAAFRNNRSPAGYPEIFVVSNRVDEHGNAIGDLGSGEVFWHSDLSYQPDPPDASMLYALEIPATGGDTSFSSMKAALAAMPAALRARIAGLGLKHDATRAACGQLRRGMAAHDPRESPGARHPLVIEHPVSGAAALYLGRRPNAYIPGLSLAASEQLVDELWSYVDTAVYTHRWTVGDVVLWDNRSVMHRRDAFDPRAHRTLHRTQIKCTTAPRRARSV